MSFRIERKYILDLNSQKFLKSCLFQEGLSILHPPRVIYSCYFDNDNLQCYLDSEDGCLPRKKIRFRWYNNNEQLYKETKFSTVEGRFKKTLKINNNTFPIQIIKYKREYFKLNGIRLTFDTDITYKDLKGIMGRTYTDPQTVMELKAPSQVSQDFLEKLINLPTSRFSKYCRGISKIKGIFSD